MGMVSKAVNKDLVCKKKKQHQLKNDVWCFNMIPSLCGRQHSRVFMERRRGIGGARRWVTVWCGRSPPSPRWAAPSEPSLSMSSKGPDPTNHNINVTTQTQGCQQTCWRWTKPALQSKHMLLCAERWLVQVAGVVPWWACFVIPRHSGDGKIMWMLRVSLTHLTHFGFHFGLFFRLMNINRARQINNVCCLNLLFGLSAGKICGEKKIHRIWQIFHPMCQASCKEDKWI